MIVAFLTLAQTEGRETGTMRIYAHQLPRAFCCTEKEQSILCLQLDCVADSQFML